jgi:biopolymer transport protein ExbB
MNAIIGQVNTLWEQAMAIWLSGGWGIIALAANALVMLALGMHVLFRLREKRYKSVPEKTWRRWINNPSERRGPIGKLLNFVTGADSLEQTSVFFEELHTTEIVPFERDLRVMKICVTAAPLLGLLGTVTGMLATFGALAVGSGGEKTMGLVAEGISEALITTETGLIIALPGLFFQYQLSRKLEGYKVFLTHLETICTQKLHKTPRKQQEPRYKSLRKRATIVYEPPRKKEIIVCKPLRKRQEIEYEPVRKQEMVA